MTPPVEYIDESLPSLDPEFILHTRNPATAGLVCDEGWRPVIQSNDSEFVIHAMDVAMRNGMDVCIRNLNAYPSQTAKFEAQI